MKESLEEFGKISSFYNIAEDKSPGINLTKHRDR